uniref:Ion_trans domain-containing protein n=1 Tax=Bursaphelenchus xylophilus TaxID=6326 RepID=A0A1I7RU10_BURXY
MWKRDFANPNPHFPPILLAMQAERPKSASCPQFLTISRAALTSPRLDSPQVHKKPLRRATLSPRGAFALMLFLQIVAFILVIVIVAGKPVEGIDIVYQIFPPGENYIPSKSDRYLYRPDASYNTLAWALFICMLLLIVINIFGLLATIYNLAYRRYYEEDQIVIRG